MEEARKTAELEGVALNQLINVAVAEKISALRTAEYFRERGNRSDRAETLRISKVAGKDNSPVEGDELPNDWKSFRKPKAKGNARARGSAAKPRRRKSAS